MSRVIGSVSTNDNNSFIGISGLRLMVLGCASVPGLPPFYYVYIIFIVTGPFRSRVAENRWVSDPSVTEEADMSDTCRTVRRWWPITTLLLLHFCTSLSRYLLLPWHINAPSDTGSIYRLLRLRAHCISLISSIAPLTTHSCPRKWKLDISHSFILGKDQSSCNSHTLVWFCDTFTFGGWKSWFFVCSLD